MYKNNLIISMTLMFLFSIGLSLAGEGVEVSPLSKAPARLILPPLNLSAPIIKEEGTLSASPPVRPRFSVQTFTSAESPPPYLELPLVHKRKKRTRSSH